MRSRVCGIEFVRDPYADPVGIGTGPLETIGERRLPSFAFGPQEGSYLDRVNVRSVHPAIVRRGPAGVKARAGAL